MRGIDFPPVTLSDVFSYMWESARHGKVFFGVALLAFIGASAANTSVPVLFKSFFDTITTAAVPADVVAPLVSILFAVLGLRLLSWLLFRGGILVANKFESETMARLRQYSFDHILLHSHGFFANTFTGSLVQRVNRFSRAFEVFTDSLFFHVIPLTVTAIGALVVTWFTEPILSGIILVWIILFLAFNFFFSRWKLKYDVRMAEADSRTTGVLADVATNHSAVTLFTSVQKESANFRNVTNAQARATRLVWDLNTMVDAIQALLLIAVEFCIFYFALGFWSSGALSIGVFVLVQVYVIQLANELWGFGRVVRQLYEGLANSKEMVEILKLPYEITDAPNAQALTVASGAIVFSDVRFGFRNNAHVLNGVELSIRGGEKVALVGPSGAGKSTFLRLLLRLHDVTSGAIAIDGQNVSAVTQESLRANIALVPQDPVLFHRSLMENIRYGRADATDDEVKEAARLAQCESFINALPEGYQTYVGERGVKLSGGERQRIAIARAMLKGAPILILDEATSSLDSESEGEIQKALHTLMQGKTVIAVAHRLSTIKEMDRIVVMQKGAIAETGSHDELLAKKGGLYANLWKRQAGGFLRDEEVVG